MLAWWENPYKRGYFYQFFTLLGLGLLLYYLYSNLQANLARQNIASGFGFLSLEAGFEISESMIEYWSDQNYLKALWVGILNTLKVALIGNGLTLALGLVLGLMRLSKNWLLSKLAQSYVEVLRNTPLLLQLFFCYTLILEALPPVAEALNPLPHVYLSQRGLYFPTFLSWEVPQLQGLNFQGGQSLTPEFLALTTGLVLHTSAFVAEIVRAGILSVKKGQWEAAMALGLKPFAMMKRVILPQALRVMIPPTTSQMLNLTKNSSLAVAIGYPDFVSVANTTMNQTGQAIEMISLIMLIYLTFSLSTSMFMNWYNRRIALVEK